MQGSLSVELSLRPIHGLHVPFACLGMPFKCASRHSLMGEMPARLKLATRWSFETCSERTGRGKIYVYDYSG
jgi:hypothetical protein